MAGVAYALDYGAVMTFAAAQGADPELLADALPATEAQILAGLNDDGEGDGDAE